MIFDVNSYSRVSREQLQWYIEAADDFLFSRVRCASYQINSIEGYVNTRLHLCIVKVNFNISEFINFEHLYFMLNFDNKKLERLGPEFEESIFDTGRRINYIYGNKLLNFKRSRRLDKQFASLLRKR